ncbi:MAG: hypothetical protein AABY18_02120 [Candidatus Thermoplasmatota archaeon]
MLSHRSIVAVAMLAFLPLLATPAGAESTVDVALRFAPEEGMDWVQPGCTTFDVEDNPCHQIATMMNGLDSPKIDVLILVPAGPFAERDMRIMRQSVEMWADGVTFLAGDMGLQWMADGVEFHIFMEMPSATGQGESEFTTYPIVDPEIVVVATNPVGGIGIGIDPLDFAGIIFGEGAGQGPCHGVANPFDMALWENLPGFDSHHGGRGGTYTEDCGGAGGNICFSVNGAVDPATSVIDFFQLYDLVSHETGHCLTLGHVGDGAEGAWSSVPTNDIMAYSADPPGLSKCVSTLDVEGLAVAMSRYLDVNGDGVVNSDDYVHANDAVGQGDRPFQIQHPDNHHYASPTRKAIDCPQPDMGPVPLSEVVNFTPLSPLRPQLAIQGLLDLQVVGQGLVNLRGEVNGASDSNQVVINVAAAPGLNGTAEDLGIANVTVTVVDGKWSGAVNLSSVAHEQVVVVSASWLDAQGALLDSDRVALLVDANATEEAPADPAAIDTPGPAIALLLVALVAAVVVRRK